MLTFGFSWIRIAGPAGIHLRMLLQDARGQGDEKIVWTVFSVLLESAESSGIDLARQEEVRYLRPALRGALRHQARDRAEGRPERRAELPGVSRRPEHRRW
jgi:hypothetical protein